MIICGEHSHSGVSSASYGIRLGWTSAPLAPGVFILTLVSQLSAILRLNFGCCGSLLSTQSRTHFLEMPAHYIEKRMDHSRKFSANYGLPIMPNAGFRGSFAANKYSSSAFRGGCGNIGASVH